VYARFEQRQLALDELATFDPEGKFELQQLGADTVAKRF
jgi:hypothetical protein